VPAGTVVGRLKFVRVVDGFRGVAVLVEDLETHGFYIISAVDLGRVFLTVPASFALSGFPGTWGPEIMVFEADKTGEVTDWSDLAMWREALSLTEVMEKFSAQLEEDK